MLENIYINDNKGDNNVKLLVSIVSWLFLLLVIFSSYLSSEDFTSNYEKVTDKKQVVVIDFINVKCENKLAEL